jgi:hypothetical protein
MRLPLHQREGAGSLHALVAHVPLAARVQRQPAVAVRHVGPLAQRGFDDGVHGRAYPQRPSCRQARRPARSASHPAPPRAWSAHGREARLPESRTCPPCRRLPQRDAAARPGCGRRRCAGTKGSLRGVAAPAPGCACSARCGRGRGARASSRRVPREAVQRRGEGVVELVDGARAAHAARGRTGPGAAPARASACGFIVARNMRA